MPYTKHTDNNKAKPIAEGDSSRPTKSFDSSTRTARWLNGQCPMIVRQYCKNAMKIGQALVVIYI